MSRAPIPLTPERRALLARKGQILYGKHCGARGRGSCAGSFAQEQLRLGHVEVVRDLLEFLDAQLERLRAHDPESLLTITESLATRIRSQLEQIEAAPGAGPV
jgi:hypothetical protein